GQQHSKWPQLTF
nr:immunoglobulin light chain junction region [Macaca mulatta]MPN91034.1 immunoglobulin light chain junction region [Macaca mulatta]MPN92126.1 immunoglobulin light chain junction region [Macaca mulatta]MPN92713.1 immunoglobulin light chain junction region [Macaca mulatta]